MKTTKTKSRKHAWKACFVDPERGVAFFDGITIEADSINDPRQDRVFPVFRKEQIFMCRQMRPILTTLKGRPAEARNSNSPKPLAFDIGTGSGVLAVWAARHSCKVYAVDISERSIEFARHNARANHVNVFDFTTWADFAHAEKPGIWLHRVRFDEEFTGKLLDEAAATHGEGCFDLIMLNAPYNPTYDEVTPALHANGGRDGQSEFKEQILLIPRLLRAGGYCAGHHMGVVGHHQRDPNVVSEVEHAFRQLNDSQAAAIDPHRRAARYGAKGEYIRVLRDDRPVRDFLSAQYSTYMVSDWHSKRIRKYIDDIASDWCYFCLLYFEFQKQQAQSKDETGVTMAETDRGGRPNAVRYASATSWRWETREWLHRCIVEHTASTISIPWCSLFTDYIVSEQTLDTEDTSSLPSSVEGASRTRLMSRSPMRLVDQWLSEVPPLHQVGGHASRVPTFGARGLPFDFIHLESVPFTPNSARLPGLRQESAVWLSHRLVAALDNPRNFAQTCFAAWNRCVRLAQDRRVAPFLHPAFMRSSGLEARRDGQPCAPELGRKWNPLIHSFLRHETDESFPAVHPVDKLTDDANALYDRFEEAFANSRNDLLGLLTDTGDRPDDFSFSRLQSDAFTSFYKTAKLDELNVAEAAAYGRECASRITSLRGSSGASARRAPTIDLEYCHATLHGISAHAFAAALRDDAPPRLSWSYLLSVPLDLSDPLYADEEGVLPSTYRGGIFLFVGSLSPDWSPRQDRVVFDLARFSTLLHNGRFNVEESRSQTFDVLETMGRSFSHEMGAHKVAMNATHKTMADVFHLEGRQATPTGNAPGSWLEPAGGITAPAEHLPTIASWLVCTTPKIYRGLEDTLSVWGSSRRWLTEQKLNQERLFREVLRDVIAMIGRGSFAAKRAEFLASPVNLADAAARDAAFDEAVSRLLTPLMDIRYGGDAWKLVWIGAESTTGAQFTFIRVIASAISNAIKHLPPDGSGNVRVNATLLSDASSLRLEVRNTFTYKKKGSPKDWGTQQVIETLIRDRWGPRVVSFVDLDRDDTTEGATHQWCTLFEVPITFVREGARIPWLRLS